jgi:hypothetical protein
MNPIIIIAIIVQSFVSRANRMAGAILGFVITTGILLWGVSLYAQGGEIAFLGFPLSQPVFLIVCAVWYGFDVRSFMRARALSGRTIMAPPPPPPTGDLR